MNALPVFFVIASYKRFIFLKLFFSTHSMQFQQACRKVSSKIRKVFDRVRKYFFARLFLNCFSGHVKTYNEVLKTVLKIHLR